MNPPNCTGHTGGSWATSRFTSGNGHLPFCYSYGVLPTWIAKQNGRISNLCRFTLERSLEWARGQTLLQLILQILAAEDGGQTRTLLRRLMEVDLIVQQGALYDFRYPVMKLWAAYYYQGLELPAVPRQQILINSWPRSANATNVFPSSWGWPKRARCGN